MRKGQYAMRFAFLWLVMSMTTIGMAWQNVSEFETEIVMALSNNAILTSSAFAQSLTNFLATPFDPNAEKTARIVNGVRELRLYIETMDEVHLANGYDIATNICLLTRNETNSWQCWQSEILRIGCFAMCDDMSSAYLASSNALSRIQRTTFTDSTNAVSRALLKYYKSQNLTIRQSIQALTAMSAARLGKRDAAISLSTDLPSSHRIPIMNLLDGD